MNEDLIGYCLGSLEPDEMLRLQRLVDQSPELQREVARIRESLSAVAESSPPIEPPCGLTERALQHIENCKSLPDQALSPAASMATSGSYRSVDFFGLAVAIAAAFAILFPTLLEWRGDARTVACQSNLRQLGQSIQAFATSQPDRRIPNLMPWGPESFAGVYGPRLNDRGLIEDPGWLWCPAEVRRRPLKTIPSLEQLAVVSGKELRQLQRVAGGSYAYSLGILDHGRYTAPRYEGRTTFAILADSVLGAEEDSPAHGRWGVNVLFEDGHIEAIPRHALFRSGDHLFLNDHGTTEAGVDPHDSTLAPSAHPPFIWVRTKN